jgi:hypothetical protein
MVKITRDRERERAREREKGERDKRGRLMKGKSQVINNTTNAGRK